MKSGSHSLILTNTNINLLVVSDKTIRAKVQQQDTFTDPGLKPGVIDRLINTGL